MNLHYSLDDAKEVGDAPWDNIVQDDFHVVIFKDKYPVTDGHLLFVPKYSANGVIEDCFADALSLGQEKVLSTCSFNSKTQRRYGRSPWWR